MCASGDVAVDEKSTPTFTPSAAVAAKTSHTISLQLYPRLYIPLLKLKRKKNYFLLARHVIFYFVEPFAEYSVPRISKSDVR
jgi:hypothetical protein